MLQITNTPLRKSSDLNGESEQIVPAMSADLSKFDIGNYRGGPKVKIILWYIVNAFVFDTVLPWPYRFKVWLLRLFGAKIGKHVVVKTHVRIKYPWRLSIGNHCWIGESCWLDNLDQITMHDNVALSQGAMLLTGNHDYTDTSFPYRLAGITLESGVWIGAQSVVCPGVTCRSQSVLTVNSVATKDLEEYGVYSGNPARMIRVRRYKR